jgi:DNA (cytosine-5)-methyltransferase 1
MTEPITMIELFGGIGAQEKALRQLKIPYEIIHYCDCDKEATLSYAAMRWNLEEEMKNFNFPSQDQMIEELQAKNLGYSFEKGKHTITSRTPIEKLKQYYISDRLSTNLGDISKVDRLPYSDIVTYSFCCQDLSVAGKGGGMKLKCDKCDHSWLVDFEHPENNNACPNCGNTNISSTRSGLLNQVQRLLAVAKNNNTLPKYLILENVKPLVGKKFKPQFDSWCNWLDSIGYNTYYEVLNGKHFGIPQNRERVFAISIRKDVDVGFKFPETIPLQLRLKDILEHNVDEKYYINNEKTEALLAQLKDKLENSVQTIKVSNQATVVDGFTDEAGTLMARDWKGFGNQAMTAVVEPQIGIVGNYMPSNHDASRIVSVDGLAPTVKENHGTVTAILEPFIVASRGRDSDDPDVNTEQKLEPNLTGCTNTITSVQKDNWVAEPTRLGNIYGEQFGTGYAGNVWDTNGISPALMTMQGGNRQPLVIDAEPVIYDDYNSRIPQDQDAITTLTTNCGASATRNGVKIIEPIVCEQRCDEGIRFFKDDVCGTLRTIDACGDKRVVEPGIRWRIRKLTEKECWRLMCFSDEDVDRAAKFVSPTHLYKQAGNSIIVNVLISIFYSLLFNDNSTEWAKHVVDFNS